MREIEFRGKSIDNGEWVIGSFSPNNEWQSYIESRDSGKYKLQHVLTETIGQYTGLLDKNGKKIFEGDILSCGDAMVPSQILWNEKWGGWAVKNLKRNEFHRLDINFNRYIGEIIGNIYENPEMLEERP